MSSPTAPPAREHSSYLLLIYGNPAVWSSRSDGQRDETLRRHAALVAELREAGELIVGAGLADSEHTTTVRGDDPALTHGPWVADSDQVSAFYLVNCGGADRATTLAQRVLDEHISAVEVRQVHKSN